MGFRYETERKRKEGRVRRASGLGMLMVFVCIAIGIVVGWWLPKNVPLQSYIPIPNSWYVPILPQVPIWPIQLVVGLVTFILLQFLVVLISGILFPLPPEEKFDKDGLYLGKTKK